MSPTLILSLLPSIIAVINNGVDFLAEIKKNAAVDTEWTEEQRAAYKAELDKLELKLEEWQKVQPL